ncbi:MAG: hypothetical protein KME16_27490 [Scytolyngbya sp. HA4215-MV1]|nr:hypothetical protein [Scytolyngbya sp. HA4215-MV1]
MPKRKIKTLLAIQTNAFQRIAEIDRCIELLTRLSEGCSDEEVTAINAELEQIRIASEARSQASAAKWKPCVKYSKFGRKPRRK